MRNLLIFTLLLGVVTLASGYKATAAECLPQTGVFVHFANITSSSVCEIIRTNNYHIQVVDTNKTFICYDQANLQSEDCTSKCIYPESLSFFRGYADGGRNLCDDYNATLHGNLSCSAYNDTLKCHGDSLFCAHRNCTYQSTYTCYCKNVRQIEKLKVDCGHGWFEPLQLLLGYKCVDQPHLIPSNSQIKRLEREDILSLTADALTKDEVVITFMISQIHRWGLLESLYYNKTTHDHEQIFELIEFNISTADYIVRVKPNHRLEALFLVDSAGKYLLWNDEITKSVIDFEFENVTEYDRCNRLECDYCDGIPNYSWCKMAKFGWPQTIMVTFLVLVSLVASLWICAGLAMVLNVCKICFCAPIKIMKKCCGYEPEWYKKLTRRMEKSKMKKQQRKGRLALEEDDIELDTKENTNLVTGDEQDWLNMVESAKKAANQNSLQDITSWENELTRELTDDQMPRPIRQEMQGALSNLGSRKKMLLRSQAKGSKASSLMTSIVILSLISTCSAQCTDGVVSSANIKSCTIHNSTHTTCTFTPKIEVALTGPGTKLCLTFLDNNGTAFYTANLTFVSIEAEVKLSNQYFTIDYIPLITSQKSCFLQSCCTYGSYHSCNDYYEDGAHQNPCSIFSPGLYGIPGHTGCRSYPGCAGNGCFSCAQSCNYFRFTATPSGPVWNVSLPGLTEFISTFEYEDKDGKIKFSTKSPQYEDTLLTAELLGVFNDLQLSFTKSFVSNGKDNYYIDASPPNVPTEGLVGDIQSNSPSAFTDSPDTVIFDGNMYDVIVDAGGVSGSFKPTGISRLPFGKKLPTEISGLMWYYDDMIHGIKAPISRRLTAELKITLKQAVQFYETRTDTCPVWDGQSSIAGCYDCSGGASVNITLKSVCYPGICLAVSENPLYELVENQISISSTYKTYNIQLLTHQKTVDFKFRISCGSNSIYVNVSGSLSEDVEIYNGLGNETYNTVRHTNSEDFDLGGMDWLRDFLGVSKSIAIIILAVVIFVFVVLIIGGLIYLFIKISRTNMGQKMNIKIEGSKKEKIQTVAGLNALKSQVAELKKNPFEEAKYQPVEN